MEINNSLNKSDLLQRLDRHLEWIKSCDTKASIVIAGAGIFLSIFTAEHSINMLNQIFAQSINNINFSNFLYLSLFLLFWGLFVYGSYCLIRVLVPMMKKEVMIFQQDTHADSLYYFESIDDKKYSEFREKMINESPEAELEDLLTQIYINAKICSSKYKFYKKGIRSTFIGIAGIITLYAVGIVLVKLGGMA
ncbi:Pycsar system effector family protein [Exiguobacterium aurantiacum]|uniref:Pycsar effector protein domain-containing protein n=1 Tax=Exiguobacterium aurantiacum TaxID=33987 RepID=A0A377HH91_9BACL|nr:Pycsar system effector family protein [Exiguobacterium aurantiacum]STO53311.1 Uncharacterised protein [Exiguobacterium aurantiacum]